MGRLHTAWSRPAADGAEGVRPRDVVLVAALGALAVLEGALRTDLGWPLATTLVAIATLPVLLWRRVRPLASIAAMTFVTTAFAIAQAVAGADPNALVATAAFLAVPYALFRWGSGRARIAGATVVAAGIAVSGPLSRDPIADTVAAVAFLGGACLIGALRRERVESRARQADAVRAREREALARDLHDTVAHHVSAIVIHAQVAGENPRDVPRVAESLGVIEREAQAVLADMRSLVHALRAPADYAPSAGLGELAGLAEPGPPPVRVRVDAPDDLPAVVASTLLRIAQEGVTNARRHGRGVRGIEVSVEAEADAVRIVVRDDGDAPKPASGDGHGLRGMSERAALLDGDFTAGPGPDGGWVLRASLPLPAEREERRAR